MRINSPGYCQHNQDWEDNKARSRGPSPGLAIPRVCDVCGNPRSKGNHKRCSAIRKARGGV